MSFYINLSDERILDLESALKSANADKQTLQSQLQNGFAAFEDFKLRKGAEVKELEQQNHDLKAQVGSNFSTLPLLLEFSRSCLYSLMVY